MISTFRFSARQRAARYAHGWLPGVLTPGAELRVEQVPAERHENVTITQEANASPHSVVIQVAGNARISDER